DQEIAIAREARARDERLASLATLAAGAAHELSTPLSTIAMLSQELQRDLRDASRATPDLAEAAEDARVIREEVRRCRDVLNLMSAEAGESRGEAFQRVTVASLLDEALRGMHHEVRIQLEDERAEVIAPPRPMALAIRGVVKNAVDASDSSMAVDVRVTAAGERVRIEVIDRGVGMTADVLERAKEPFFTTKPAGEGMGLGLFLAHDLARRAGGALQLRSHPDRGTSVIMHLPSGRSANDAETARHSFSPEPVAVR
ncbi:MAG: ATP-binding protein, partial [Myxococcota bacterium]